MQTTRIALRSAYLRQQQSNSNTVMPPHPPRWVWQLTYKKFPLPYTGNCAKFSHCWVKQYEQHWAYMWVLQIHPQRFAYKNQEQW